MAYSSWYHWNCGRTERKAATINQLAWLSYSFYVQLAALALMYYPGGMKARISPVQWSKPYNILAPTQDSNPGGRILNHERWPLHYHCTRGSTFDSLGSGPPLSLYYCERCSLQTYCMIYIVKIRCKLPRSMLALQHSIGADTARVALVRTLPTFGNLTWDPPKIMKRCINSLQLGPYHLFNPGGTPATPVFSQHHCCLSIFAFIILIP